MAIENAHGGTRTLRVIGGIAKGVRLKGRRSRYLRPTSDMVREALFAILGERIVGSSFLDLYAGTGAVGVEALSRGAGTAVFVERRPELAQVIRENLLATHLEKGSSVLCSEGTRAVARLVSLGRKFDFVFADPPYYTDAKEVLDELHRILGRGGVLICQHSKREEASSPAGLEQIDQRPFGDAALTFYRPSPTSVAPQEGNVAQMRPTGSPSNKKTDAPSCWAQRTRLLAGRTFRSAKRKAGLKSVQPDDGPVFLLDGHCATENRRRR